jgi:hypothetical protein
MSLKGTATGNMSANGKNQASAKTFAPQTKISLEGKVIASMHLSLTAVAGAIN